MKNTITYYSICLLAAFMLSFSAQAQQHSLLATNSHAGKAIKKEQKRERKRVDRTEKLTANAENKLSGKRQYKSHTRVKVKSEKAPSEKRRRHRGHKKAEIRD